jgi:membrane dipeptidase
VAVELPSSPAGWADWLRAVPLLDGHNDLPIAHRHAAGYDLDTLPLDVPQETLCTDLPRLHAGGLGAQFWSVFVSASQTESDAVVQTLEQIDFVRRLVARYPDRLASATSVDDVRAANRSGRIACLMGAEGGHQIGSSLGVLRQMYELGVRYLTLTHNSSTTWADSATDEPRCGGLSGFGRDVVREMNRLGMLVDLSHVAETTMVAALDTTSAPVVFSHSSARALTDVTRNVPDHVLARLAGNGGVCMVTFVPEFVNPAVAAWRDEAILAAAEVGVSTSDYRAFVGFCADWSAARPKPQAVLSDVVVHIEHVRDVAGVDHVGLGGDFDGSDTYPVGLADVSGYPVLFDALAKRGWSSLDLSKLAGENVLRALGDAEGIAAGFR